MEYLIFVSFLFYYPPPSNSLPNMSMVKNNHVFLYFNFILSSETRNIEESNIKCLLNGDHSSTNFAHNKIINYSKVVHSLFQILRNIFEGGTHLKLQPYETKPKNPK